MMDIKTPDGRMSLFMQAFIDEMYALDGSRRASDSIRHRKSRQITVGMPPFGTVRNAEGHLIPSSAGASKLSAGGWRGGESGGEDSVERAVWRRYHDAARRVRKLYAENKGGYRRIAKSLTRERWAFRDRWGTPRLFSSDNVRRIVASWRESFETARRAAIAVLRQQLANLLDLYKNAVITAAEFYRDRSDRERKIAYW
ncbi:MAG: hypothetical protein IPM16_10925 [Chloroflexi bacterium]|nr:hypothetical protein [Chloroflexota bacterium]